MTELTPEQAPSTTTRQARGFTASAALAGSGLLVLGLSASVYLVLSARMVGAGRFSEIAVLWTLVYTVGIGLFLPFEQEVSRVATTRLARQQPLGALVRRAGVQMGAILALLVVVVVALMSWRVTRVQLLADSWWFALALVVAAAGLAVQYLQRGLFSASGRFGAYGGQQGAEGVLRIVLCVVLAAAGVHAPVAYAAVLALCPWLAALLVLPALRTLRAPRPADPSAEPVAPTPLPAGRSLDHRLAWLVAATLSSQALANLAAPAVRLLSTASQSAAAGNFLSGLTIARIPLLLFAAVQAVLLPRLVRARHERDPRGFARNLGTVLGATAAIGLVGVIGVAVIGPWTLRLLFGRGFDLPRLDLVLLAASAAVLMLALALHSAVLALDDHRWTALSWIAGVVAFLAALALPGSVLLRAEIALVLGAVVVAALLGGRIGRDDEAGIRRPGGPLDAASVPGTRQ